MLLFDFIYTYLVCQEKLSNIQVFSNQNVFSITRKYDYQAFQDGCGLNIEHDFPFFYSKNYLSHFHETQRFFKVAELGHNL